MSVREIAAPVSLFHANEDSTGVAVASEQMSADRSRRSHLKSTGRSGLFAGLDWGRNWPPISELSLDYGQAPIVSCEK